MLTRRRIIVFVLGSILGVFLLGATVWPAVAETESDLCNHSLADPDAGIPACTSLIERDRDGPNSPGYFNNRGVAKVAKGDLDSAIKDFTSALDRKPNLVDALRNRGFAHHLKAEFDAAIADFNRALRISAKSAPIYNARGAALFRKAEFDRAIADYNKAIEIDGKYANAFYNRGQAYFLKRRFDRAIADFDAFIKLAPRDVRGYIQRADARASKADFTGAIRDYDAAIRIDAKSWEAHTHRGEARRLQNDLVRSLNDHDKALELNPNAKEAYVNRALARKDQGDLDKALADCDEAVLIDPNYGPAYLNRGLIRRLGGNLKESLSDLDKALSLEPRSHLALTFHADSLRELGDQDRAIEQYDAAIRILPDFAAAYTGRGLAYEKKGDRAKAKADFEKAIGLKADADGLAKPAQETARARLAALKAEEAAGAMKLAQRDIRTPTEQEKKAKADREAKERAEFEARIKAEAQTEIARLQAALAARKRAEELEKQAVAPAPDPGRRVALVIGNSAYRATGVPYLPNPQRDAKAVAATLRKLGFETVIAENDLTRDQFRAALAAFEEKSADVDWAVVYYAGHGIEVGGANYLIPVDAKLATSDDVEWEAVKLDIVLRATQKAKKLRLVMLDACRNNPFVSRMRVADATRSIGRGFGRIEPGKGTLVAYAAKDGELAQDGDGDNSPFTTAFLKYAVKPKLEINLLFRHMRDEVLRATKGVQEPFTYGSLPGEEFYFAVK
jgi:tetratricopeptide (TPR) repeat protein